MTTHLLRRRYLVALGLSTSVLASCRGAEPPGTAPTDTALPETATPTSTTAATAAATTEPTAPVASATVMSWEPKVSPPASTSTSTVTGPGDTRPMPSCPTGKFCVPESKSSKGQAPAPFEMCASDMPAPGEAPPGDRKDVRFDAAQTKRERTQTANACCYSWFIPCPGGRPLMVEGTTRTADEAPIATWLDDSEGDAFALLSVEARALLAEHYAAEAAYEHASIASFARVSLSLLAAGAPPELVHDTHRAALDEVAHARAMYSMASACRGGAVGPGPLDLGGVTLATPSIVEIAEEAFLEGCVGEVTAALVLREEAAIAIGDKTRVVLARMAGDEEEHAELAWRTVAWALSREPSGVRAMLERVARSVATEVGADGRLGAEHERHRLPGVTTPRERARIRARAVSEVTLPCLEALLA